MGLGAETPLFFPKPTLALVPISVLAGDEVMIDATGVSNDGTLITGSPVLRDFQAVEWVCGSGSAQTYQNGESTKLSAPMESCVDGIRKGLTSYHIKNTTVATLTLYLRGM